MAGPFVGSLGRGRGCTGWVATAGLCCGYAQIDAELRLHGGSMVLIINAIAMAAGDKTHRGNVPSSNVPECSGVPAVTECPKLLTASTRRISITANPIWMIQKPFESKLNTDSSKRPFTFEHFHFSRSYDRKTTTPCDFHHTRGRPCF